MRSKVYREWRSYSLFFLTVAILVVGMWVKSTNLVLIGVQPTHAQTIPSNYQLLGKNKTDAWRQVYKQLPDLPLENQYINQETGKVDPDDTLVSRLIRYHVYVKGRPTIYRLDWKLTLADYLGANENIKEFRYPGADSLRQNPLEGDRAVINRLSLAERNALVQVLVNIFNPDYQNIPGSASSTTTQPTVTPAPTLAPSRPGDAKLLTP